MTISFWMSRCTSGNVSWWASRWPLPGFLSAMFVRWAHWPCLHPSGPFLFRALQRLRLGDDVCDAAHCFRHSCFCLRILQSRWVQQKLSQRERWVRLHKHDSIWLLFNWPSVEISDLEHMILYALLPTVHTVWMELGHHRYYLYFHTTVGDWLQLKKKDTMKHFI